MNKKAIKMRNKKINHKNSYKNEFQKLVHVEM